MTDKAANVLSQDNRDGALVAGYEGIVCDLDGVVYRGAQAVDGAIPALQDCRRRGLGVVYATNNASRESVTVAEQLRSYGLSVESDAVLTSSQAAAEQLRRELPPGAPVLAVGGPGVAAALAEVGLTPVRPAERKDALAVLQGYGPDVSASDLAEAARQVAAGRRWVATNPDLTLPHEWGFGPGCGAFLEVVTIATGRRPDVVIGKPFAPLYLECALRLGSAPERTLAIGDRLDTDIDGAANAGMDSVWVLTGVDRPAALVANPDRAIPTFLMTTLAGLGRPYAAPVVEGSSARCGSVRVALRDNGTQRDWEIEDADADDSWDRANAILRAGLAVLLHLRDGADGASAEVADLVELAYRLDRSALGD